MLKYKFNLKTFNPRIRKTKGSEEFPSVLGL